MLTGSVKWFDPRKGYGFIVGPEGRDVFVHYTCIDGEGFRFLRQGDEVEYEASDTPRGLQARLVRQMARVAEDVGAARVQELSS